MVTPRHSSGTIRKLIGQAKRRLLDGIQENTPTKEELEQFSVPELEEALNDILDLIDLIKKACQAIKELDSQWTEIIQVDSNEENVRHVYINTYGDYMAVIESGNGRVNSLQDIYEVGLQRLHTLDKDKAVDLPSKEELHHLDAEEKNKPMVKVQQENETSPNSSMKHTGNAGAAIGAVASIGKQVIGTLANFEQSITGNTSTTSTNAQQAVTGQHGTLDNNRQVRQSENMSHNNYNGHNGFSGQAGFFGQPNHVAFQNFSLALPPIAMPTFAGDIFSYHEFREIFDSIMDRIQADDLTRLHYLKSVVTGEASDLIRSLKVTSTNFILAINTLEETYGGKLRIKHLLLQKLRDLPDISNSSTDASALQRFVASATLLFNQLITLGCEMDNVATADLIECRLPKRVLTKIYGNCETDSPFTASELLKRIREISRSENLVAAIYNKKNDGQRNVTTMAAVQHNQQSKKFQHRSGHGGMRRQNDRPNIEKPCAFCVDDRMRHKPENCRKYPTLAARKQRAQELRLCYRCLNIGHGAKRCSDCCACCNSSHHEAICPKKNQETVQQNGARDNAGNSTSQQSFNNGGQQQFGRQQGSGYQQSGTGYRGYQGRQNQNRQGGNQQYGNRNQTTVATVEEEFEEVNHAGNVVNVAVVHQRNNFDVEESKMDVITHEVSIEEEEKEELITFAPQTKIPPIIMMTADLAILDKDGNECVGTVFFDSGSNTSYISKKFAEKLQLDSIGQKKLQVSTFASKHAQTMDTRLFQVMIKTKASTEVVELCEVDHIASNLVTAKVDTAMLESLLQGQPLQIHRERKDVDILIGLDFYLHMLGQVNTFKLENGLQLNVTDCGPIVSGREQVITNVDKTMIAMDQREDVELLDILSKFWSLESIGILDLDPKMKAAEEAYLYFKATTTRKEDGRYIVRLPYASKEKINSNRQLAFFRLQGTIKRLEKDSTLLKKYADIFVEQLNLDFIEEVPDESTVDGPVLHYLSHHPVIKESSKSTKVRIVFDGSARTRKTDKSLNDQLHTGENLLPDIAACLLRMRSHPILISADIQKAFLQMELHIEDRDATRFLWIDSVGKIVCYRYKRVPFGLKSSPFLLNASIRDLLKSTDHPMAAQMARSCYVDNVYVGVPSVEEAENFYNVSKSIFKQAMMNLCQYVSNSQEANAYFAEQEKAEPEDEQQKLLGVKWNTAADELMFKLPSTSPELLTKRKALKWIASCYDPIGILTPVTLIGKLFLQQLNNEKKSWDTPLSAKEHEQWQKIMDQWSGAEWRVPRQFFSKDAFVRARGKELHVFTDASKVAYGAVAYIRILLDDVEKPQTSFLMAKSRVAPLKSQYSIPQLEILALLTGVRLATYCQQEIDLEFDRICVWSDSLCSLDSMNSSTITGSRFVRNRVAQIQELADNYILTHVPGKINPADLLTRGTSFDELKDNVLWSKGPEFLSKSTPLPIRKFSTEMVPSTTALNNTYEPIIEVERFQSFHRLLRMVMILVSFVTKKKLFLHDRVRRAKRIIYRLAQTTNPPKEETIKALRLTKDIKNDLWIYTGRVPQQAVVFIPQGHVAKLLILDEHIRNHHSSILFTLTQLRRDFWIPHGRSYLRRILAKCPQCALLDAIPYRQKPFAMFPDTRVSPSKPFEHTGLDYAGPLKVTINNEVKEIFFILFTCLYSRFVVTEIVMDTSGLSFLSTLRRFSSLYGSPKTIVCDNAQQLRMTDRVVNLVKAQQHGSSRIFSTTLPEFRFIAAHSPWAGGVYERMIGLIKRALTRAGATKRLMELEDFRTTLAECTSIINCRPLTYVSSDDNITPLRPVDFVFPHGRVHSESLLMLYEMPDTDGSSWTWTRRNLVEAWEQLSSITEDFRRRWSKDYVQVLQERADFEYVQKKGRPFQPKVGDVVIIGQPSGKFAQWPLGRIIEVKKRSAVVKNGRTKRIGEHPWNSLFPIETDLMEDTVETDNKTSKKDQAVALRQRRSPRFHTTTSTFLSLALLIFLPTMTDATLQQNFMTTQSKSTNRTVDQQHWIGDHEFWIFVVALIATCYGIHVCLSVLSMMSSCLWILARIGSIIVKGISKGCVFCWNCCVRRTTAASKTTVVILLYLWINGTSGCNEIASIQATDDVCTLSKDEQSCSLNTVSILNIRPNGSVGCYRVRNQIQQLEAVIEIQAEAIISMCHEKTHHFQRDFKIEHVWSHRCSGAGSCKGERCEKLKEDDSVPEFTSTSMNAPGFSRCFTSCGCVTCGGCFLCSPSCLFSRIFAVPTSDSIYEIVTCGAWETAISMKISINGKDQMFLARHGLPIKIPHTNITVIVTGFSTPPAPVHGATFIKRYVANRKHPEVGYTFTSVAQSGAPTRGFVGEFQCPSSDAARQFNCVFDENLCQCIPKGTSVTCGCKHIKNEEIIRKTKLPHLEGGINVVIKDNLITTHTTSSGMVAIQLQFRNETIRRIVKDDTCAATRTTLKGCFSCGSGAALEMYCTSKNNDAIKATLLCPSLVEFLECSSFGKMNKLSLYTNSKTFIQNCSLQCGKNRTYVMIEGELKEEMQFDASIFREKFVSFQEFVDPEGVIGSVSEAVSQIWSSITSFIGKWTLIIFLVIGILLLMNTVPFISILCRQCRNRRTIRYRSRKHRAKRR